MLIMINGIITNLLTPCDSRALMHSVVLDEDVKDLSGENYDTSIVLIRLVWFVQVCLV